jgi:MFS superfamily sulfate permease-like transporter
VLRDFVPVSLRGYQRSWLVTDLVAGATLSAVAIPETMGYTWRPAWGSRSPVSS